MRRSRHVLFLMASIAFTSQAAEEPFVGTWVETVELHRDYPENTRTFEIDGKKLKMTSVLGNPQEYVLDGAAHSVENQEGVVHICDTPSPGVFTRRILRGNAPVSEVRWEVSADGKTLLGTTTYHTLTGGKTQWHTFDRISGESGLNGKWRPRPTRQSNGPETVVIGLSEEGLIVTRGWGRSWIVDGKSRVAQGNASEAKITVTKVASTVIERRTLTTGNTTFLTRMKIESDGKTLTQTDEFTSENGTPITSISVYVRQ